MSEPQHPRGHRRNLSTEISETARLDLIVPHDSNLDIKEAIAAGLARAGGTPPVGSAASSVGAVAHIAQRANLFYGEPGPPRAAPPLNRGPQTRSCRCSSCCRSWCR